MALFRGFIYALGFLGVLAVMGLVTSWWSLLMVPVAVLIAFGFAALGMGITSYLTTFQQMDLINFVMLPMFLFSATLYPITVYPEPIQWFVMAMPLWHGVELMRQLSFGHLSGATLVHVLYFLGMTAAGGAAPPRSRARGPGSPRSGWRTKFACVVAMTPHAEPQSQGSKNPRSG